MENIIPEIVSQTADGKHMRSMRYSELIPVLIKAIQEQQILIEQQNLAILNQSKNIDRLETMLKKLLN